MAIINYVQDVKENMFLMNIKIGKRSKKNQMEILEVKIQYLK